MDTRNQILAPVLWGVLLLALLATTARAAGFSRSDNFIVLAADATLADEALARAEQYRREIAQEWLGEELPPSVGQTVLHVAIDGDDSAHTWVIDDPRRKYHRVWVHGSREQVLGSTLQHEIAHVVLATQYPGLARWVSEGIASTYDDPARVAIRERILEWYVETGNWPPLGRILSASAVRAGDQESYAVAASLVEYLLTRGDRAKLLACGGAVEKHYGLSVRQLESGWREWVRR